MVPKLGVMKILIDYQQLTPGTAERALVQVTKQLASAGLTVVSVGADGKPKRVGEVSYREVLLTCRVDGAGSSRESNGSAEADFLDEVFVQLHG